MKATALSTTDLVPIRYIASIFQDYTYQTCVYDLVESISLNITETNREKPQKNCQQSTRVHCQRLQVQKQRLQKHSASHLPQYKSLVRPSTSRICNAVRVPTLN